jgi:hypothetical protein
VQHRPAGAVAVFQFNTMLYRSLKNNTINLDSKQTIEFDAQTGVVFVPQQGSKIFLHWFTSKGNIRSTFTMTYPTWVEGKLKIINGLDAATSIHVIQLD